MRQFILPCTLILLFGVTHNILAEDTGFLSDYSNLEAEGSENTRIYRHPDAFERLAVYQAIMIDQPQLIIAADSKIKSLKPDDIVKLAEAIRITLSNKLAEDYYIVDQPGPDVLLLRVAASNLYLKKAKRGFLSYTPVGFVVHAAKSAMTDEITKKISFVEVNMEAEILDSLSGEQLVAVVTQRGQRKDKKQDVKADPTTWDEMLAVFEVIGARLDCRLDNARLSQEEQKDCIALFPEYAEESAEGSDE